MSPAEVIHIKKMQRGDASGFEWIFATYHKKIYHYCLRFVQKQEVAEEIASSVLLRIWQKRFTIDTNRSVSGLIFKMTKDLTMSHLRKVARRNELRVEFLSVASRENRNTLEEIIILEEYMEMANQAVKQLPPRCRQIYKLHHKDCLDNKHIAKKLNISPHTVKAHLFKASNIIKAYLQVHTDIVFYWLVSAFLLY